MDAGSFGAVAKHAAIAALFINHKLRKSATQSPSATGGESAQISAIDYQGYTNGHLEAFVHPFLAIC
jgi:hypothetical protein